MKIKSKIIPFILFCVLVIISSCKGCDGCKGCLCSSEKTKDTVNEALYKTKKMIENNDIEKSIKGVKKVYKKIKE